MTYIDFLTPAMLAVTTVMAGTNAGVAAAIDHTNGLHDRFATLPDAARPFPALARTINETVFALGRARDPRSPARRCSASASTAPSSTRWPASSCSSSWPAR